MHPKSISAELERQYPLAKYSFYAHGRVQLLMEVRGEILKELDLTFQDLKVLRFENLRRAESLSWLWVLGAYEVVRTMEQAERCFSLRAQHSLRRMKRQLKAVRMPSAKMEQPGQYVAVPSRRSPAELRLPDRDLSIGDPDKPHSVRRLLDQFAEFVRSFEEADVLASHESAYPNGT